MKFVLIFGPQAVGKMTVGQELAKITELKLFHNHMTIEPLIAIFGGTEVTWRLSDVFRRHIFEAAAHSDLYGLIFTYVWAFDLAREWDWVDSTCRVFEDAGADIYFVELEADLNERLRRNVSAHRLEHKPTKRNLEWSTRDLTETAARHRLNSHRGEITRDKYLRIDNTKLDAHEVARMVKTTFGL